MPAIPAHETGTSDRAWDGPANEARLKTGQDYAYYRRAYAWVEEGADRSLKSSYRFIHHFVSDDGVPGEASIRACQAGIAVLNGARGGTTIPDSDVPGVYRHLAAHLRDAGLEPPPLSRAEETTELMEAGMFYADIEMRGMTIEAALDAGDMRRVAGVAWRYPEPDLYGLSIAPGAFRESLERTSGVVPLLWQHDSGWPIGLAEAVDSRSELKIDAALDDGDEFVGRIWHKVKTGLVRGLSIGFSPLDWGPDDLVVTKARLWEVSLVTFPAHESAGVTVVRAYGPSAWRRNPRHDGIERLHRILDARLRAAEQGAIAPLISRLERLCGR